MNPEYHVFRVYSLFDISSYRSLVIPVTVFLSICVSSFPDFANVKYVYFELHYLFLIQPKFLNLFYYIAFYHNSQNFSHNLSFLAESPNSWHFCSREKNRMTQISLNFRADILKIIRAFVPE